MDTSETYIRMCKKAEEIQEQWYCACGDWYVDTVTFPKQRIIEAVGGHYPKWEDDDYDYSYGLRQTRSFWLPRQDELQEMVLLDPDRKDAWGDPMPPDPKDDSVFWLFHDFTDKIQERKRSQQTGEQLWLRYVMKEKYGKTWDGEAWVK